MSTVQEKPNEIDAEYPITDDQLRFFRENGFIKLKEVFGPDTIATYGEAVTRVTLENNPRRGIPMEKRTTYEKAFIQVGNLWEKDPLCRDLTFSKRLAGIAARLLEVSSVRLWHDQALYKEPGGGPTPWHVDQQYWPMLTDRSITAWIPLQAVPLEMGPMAFGVGTHRMNIARHLEISDKSEAVIAESVQKYKIEQVYEPFELGEVSFHLGWTLHRAGANSSDEARKVHTVIYMDAQQRLIEPQSNPHKVDWEAWTPSTPIGEIMADPKNPVLYG